MKKVELEHRLYSVTTMDEYTRTPDLFSPKFTAIEGNSVVLPIRSVISDNGPGYYYQPGAMCSIVIKPDDPSEYSADRIISYEDVTSIDQIIANNQLIKDIQQEIMTDGENILHLKIGDQNSPEMRAVKQAINTKQVNKKQYEDRFDQFQNDMRLLKGDTITLSKIRSICGAFDIGVRLTLYDIPDCPNPMNTEIEVDLTDGGTIK